MLMFSLVEVGVDITPSFYQEAVLLKGKATPNFV